MEKLFVITAPSGVGKTALVMELTKRIPSIVKVISTTTRSMREGEIDGESYYFVSREKFLADVAAGEFVEYAEVFGNLYGTSKKGIKAATAKGDALLIIDVQGAALIRKMGMGETSIFIMPPSMEELERRLKVRNTDADAVIAYRLSIAPSEMAEAPAFTHTIVNDDFETAVSDLVAIVTGNYTDKRRMCA